MSPSRISILVAVCVSLCCFRLHGQTTKWSRIAGQYRNVDYGFEVTIPKGLVGLGTRPPNPNHGFVIDLATGTKVWVDATYANPDEPYEFSNHDARLGSLKAELRIWQDKSPGAEAIHETVVAADRGILYTIGLDSEPARKREAVRVLDSLVNSFHTIPIR